MSQGCRASAPAARDHPPLAVRGDDAPAEHKEAGGGREGGPALGLPELHGDARNGAIGPDGGEAGLATVAGERARHHDGDMLRLTSGGNARL